MIVVWMEAISLLYHHMLAISTGTPEKGVPTEKIYSWVSPAGGGGNPNKNFAVWTLPRKTGVPVGVYGVLFGEHGHAGVGDSAAQALAVDGLHGGLHALIAIVHRRCPSVISPWIASDLSKPTPTMSELPDALIALPVPVVLPSLQPKMPTTPWVM